MKIYIVLLLFFSFYVEATEKEKSIAPDFSAIQGVLKNDGLDGALREKLAANKKRDKIKASKEHKKYSFPNESDFWSFTSEYWLIKNAPALKWDFEKPDYGLEKYFAQFLENFGYYEVKFKILLIDSPNVTHFGLPTGRNDFLAILSVPFIRALNLSKLEISLILFEDFIRVQEGYFKDFVTNKTVEKHLNRNFKKSGFDKRLIARVLKKYDEIVFDKGFSFQQQFKVTKKVSRLLKSQMKLWNTYYKLIGRIKDLVEQNMLYKSYSKIYPSPELQQGWLTVKE